MYKTPNSNRKHIGIFGKTNVGKSSFLNAIFEQEISIVSEINGTTTDSVTKAMELIPFGPVLFIDTAGLDDSGILGELRVRQTKKEFRRTDFAIYLMDATNLDEKFYAEKLLELKKYNIPHLLVINKIDLVSESDINVMRKKFPDAVFVSTDKNFKQSILDFKNILIEKLSHESEDPSLLADLVPYNGKIILVVPI
ncbi:MAG: GTPase, partial [Fusobacteriaceae bacterium]